MVLVGLVVSLALADRGWHESAAIVFGGVESVSSPDVGRGVASVGIDMFDWSWAMSDCFVHCVGDIVCAMAEVVVDGAVAALASVSCATVSCIALSARGSNSAVSLAMDDRGVGAHAVASVTCLSVVDVGCVFAWGSGTVYVVADLVVCCSVVVSMALVEAGLWGLVLAMSVALGVVLGVIAYVMARVAD